MSSGHEVSGETLDGLSRDTTGDCKEIHCWERKNRKVKHTLGKYWEMRKGARYKVRK